MANAEATVMELDKYYMKGAVIAVEGRYVKVSKELRRLGETGKLHEVVPATEKQYRSRIGKVQVQEPKRGNPNLECNPIGSVMPLNGEYLRIEKIERVTHPMGGGYTTYAIGHFVPEEKANILQAEWEKKMEPVRAHRELMRRQLDI